MKLIRLVVVFSIITFALSACSKEKVQQTIDNAKAAASDASDKAKQQATDAVNQATQAVTEKVKQSPPPTPPTRPSPTQRNGPGKLRPTPLRKRKKP